MNFRFLYTTFVAVIVIFTIGCSGSDVMSPDPVGPLSHGKTVMSGDINRDLWGLWTIRIDPVDATAEVVPMRGPMFTANVNSLLEKAPGNLLIGEMDVTDFFTEGRLDCTVTLRHPFPGLDMYNGFDVWGVFITDGSMNLLYEDLVYSDGLNPGEGLLLNPDGYTRWFNYPEFNGSSVPLFEFTPGKLGDLSNPTATLNAYKAYADGLDAEDDFYDWITNGTNSDDRSIFRAGSSNSRRYELKFPVHAGEPVVSFQYAVVATWEPGDPEITDPPNEYDPEDFPSSANCEEAFLMHVRDNEGTTLYNDGAGNFGGSFCASLEIFDWQGGMNPDGVPGEIGRLILEGDFLPSGSYVYEGTALEDISQEGYGQSSVFAVEIPGCVPSEAGEAGYWIIAEAAGTNGDTYYQGFPTEYPDGPRAAFIRSTVTVVSEATGFTVTAIDPDTAPLWSYVDDATVSGTGFQDGATIELRKTGQDPVVATDVNYIAAAELTCDLDLAGAVSGAWDVVVINPDLEEAVLPGGFIIEGWSDESEINTDFHRVPGMVEMYSGPLVLAAPRNDNTMRYMVFDTDTGEWEGPYLLAPVEGNALITSMAADRDADYVYYSVPIYHLYRYQGGTGTWEEDEHPIVVNRCHVMAVDSGGRANIINNFGTGMTMSHFRQPYWGCNMPNDWEWFTGFSDSANALALTQANVTAYDSSGNLYVTYIKDYNLSYFNYSPAGPRTIRVEFMPDSENSNPHSNIEQLSGVGIALDSPSVTVDPDDVAHLAYRKYDTSSGNYMIRHWTSDDQGSTWVPQANIYEGSGEPYAQYVFLHSDSSGYLHCVYRTGIYWYYVRSTDGSTWSDPETINPSADDNTSGIYDITPRVLVTSDDYLHIAWIRGNPTSGYGYLNHRFRHLAE